MWEILVLDSGQSGPSLDKNAPTFPGYDRGAVSLSLRLEKCITSTRSRYFEDVFGSDAMMARGLKVDTMTAVIKKHGLEGKQVVLMDDDVGNLEDVTDAGYDAILAHEPISARTVLSCAVGGSRVLS